MRAAVHERVATVPTIPRRQRRVYFWIAELLLSLSLVYGVLASRTWVQAVFPMTAFVCAAALAALYYKHRNEP